MATTTLPPGPKGRFLIGHLNELRTDLLGFYERSAREYGDVFLVRFGFRRVYVITHPDLIEEVLTSRHFIKHYALRMNQRLLGHGLLSSEGDFWRRQRKLAQPAFHRERIAAYAEVMVAFAGRRLGERSDDMLGLNSGEGVRPDLGADAVELRISERNPIEGTYLTDSVPLAGDHDQGRGSPIQADLDYATVNRHHFPD